VAERGESEFRVETVHLDLPPLVATLAQRLREAGVPVTAERAAEFAHALTIVRPESRRRLYWSARSMFVSDESHAAAFDRVFAEVFGADAPPVLRTTLPDARTAPAPPDVRPPAERPEGARPGKPRTASRIEVAGAPSAAGDVEDGAEVEVPLAMASDEERLAQKSFDALEPGELARLYRMMSRLELATPSRRTRRFERAHHGRRVDMRRTLRSSLRTGGDAVHLARRRRRVVRRPLVLLCDISGSMEPYARAYLQFLASAAGSGRHAEAFVFATRLTRVSRALASRHPEIAIRRAAAAVPDWSSGTRIGDALKQFNDRYGRRGMARGAVVVILSDGWERGDPALVGQEMARLARLAHRIVWVNPRAATTGFSVRAGGMVAALEHCDALVSGHSFEALGEVVEAISAPTGGGLPLPELAEDGGQRGQSPDEDWPSATPEPGSSVAMPSGHGPSRGRTTPGWSIGGS
jgi:uncharacterized protein with von Willebrand factor type A (vWA) domain